MAMDKASEQLKADGLRYKTKAVGSPFSPSSAGGMMSCLRCGLHKPRANGIFTMMFAARQFVCFDCRPPKVDGVAKQTV